VFCSSSDRDTRIASTAPDELKIVQPRLSGPRSSYLSAVLNSFSTKRSILIGAGLDGKSDCLSRASEQISSISPRSRSTTGTGTALKLSELCARYFFLGDLPNLAMMSSAVSSPLLTFSTAVLNAKPSLGFESIKRLRSAIGSRLSYFFRSSSGTFRARPAFPRFLLRGIVLQALCPRGKARKCRLSSPTRAKTSPHDPAIREGVDPKKSRSCVCQRKKLTVSMTRLVGCSKPPLWVKT
jgi:hypothetical protein